MTPLSGGPRAKKNVSVVVPAAALEPIAQDNPLLLTSHKRAPPNMSVATKNPFALLDGPFSTLELPFYFSFSFSDDAPATPAPVKKEEPTAAPAAAAARGTATRGRGGPASRGGKYYPRGGKPQSKDASAPVTEDADATKKCASSFFCIFSVNSHQILPQSTVASPVMETAPAAVVVAPPVEDVVVLSTGTRRLAKRL